MDLVLDQGRGRRADVAIHVIKEVDAHHDGEDIPGIASRHGGILWSARRPRASASSVHLERLPLPARFRAFRWPAVGRLGLGELKCLYTTRETSAGSNPPRPTIPNLPPAAKDQGSGPR